MATSPAAAAAAAAASPSRKGDATSMTVRRASAVYGNSPDPKRLGLTTEIRGVTFDVDTLSLTELRLLVARMVHTHPAIVARASSHVLRLLRNDSDNGYGRGERGIRGGVGGSERGGDDGDGGRSSPPSPSPPLPDPLDPAEEDDPEAVNMAADGLAADKVTGIGGDRRGLDLDRNAADNGKDQGKGEDGTLAPAEAGRSAGGSTGALNGTGKRGSSTLKAKRVAGKQKSPPTKKKKNRPISKRPTWEERFDELRRMKSLLGHTRPTKDFVLLHPQWKPLVDWANNQRRYRTKIMSGERPHRKTLTTDRMEKLDSIGFEWSKKHTKMKFDEMFDHLLKLKAILGHTKPSDEWLRDNPSWNSWNGWAEKQRADEKAGRVGERRNLELTEERIRKLNAVGFEWLE